MVLGFTENFRVMDNSENYFSPFSTACYAYFDTVEEFSEAVDKESTNPTGIKDLNKNCHFATFVEVPFDSDEGEHGEEVTDKEIVDKLVSALTQKVRYENLSEKTEIIDKIVLPSQVVENFDKLISLYHFCITEGYGNKIFKEMPEVLLNN